MSNNSPLLSIFHSLLSRHLRELRASRLVASEKVGLEHHYRLTAGPLREVFGFVDASPTAKGQDK